MNKYLIRFNKSRGNPGRGTIDHVWRVFEYDNNSTKEYLCKHIKINVPSFSEKSADENGNDDWNICCYGTLIVDKNTSTLTIEQSDKENTCVV